MKLPICEQDAAKKELCSECRKRLEKKELTELDVKIAIAIAELSKEFPMRHVEFTRAFDTKEFLFLACRGRIGSIIGKDGKIVSELTKQLGKKIRVVEETQDRRKAMQDMVGMPIRVLGVNRVYKPEGSEFKVIISRKDREKLQIDEKELKEAIEWVLNAKTIVSFE